MNNFKFYMEKVSPTVINERNLTTYEKSILERMVDFLTNYLEWLKNHKVLIKYYKNNKNNKNKNNEFITNKTNFVEILKKSKSIYKLINQNLAKIAKTIEKNNNNNATTKKAIKEILERKSNLNLAKTEDINSTINTLKSIIKNGDTQFSDNIDFINIINSQDFDNIAKEISGDRIIRLNKTKV